MGAVTDKRAQRAALRAMVAHLEAAGRSGGPLRQGYAADWAHTPASAGAVGASGPPIWRLDDPTLAAVFAGPGVQAGGGVHEVAAGAYEHHPAAAGFGLALLGGLADRDGPLIWVRTRRIEQEFGRLSGHGLVDFAIAPQRVTCVAARDDRAALWVAEEALVSGVVTGVIAEVQRADFTSLRRLVLAAGGRAAPLVLVQPHASGAASPARTRWRLAAAPSADTSQEASEDARVPGPPRWRADLVRRRPAWPHTQPSSFLVEWSDESGGASHGLRVVHELVDRAVAPHPRPVWRRAATGTGTG